MSLITLKSPFDSQDEAYLFRCHFPQPIVIKPNSEIELLNFECRRNDGFIINENNNISRIKLGAASDNNYKQRLVKIPNGNYSGQQLTDEFCRQMNLTTVNSAFRQSGATIAAGNKSGFSGTYNATGGDDDGPFIQIENNQNLITDALGAVNDSKTDWVFADIDEGTTFSDTSYLDTNVNVAPTTFAAGTNLTGKFNEFIPKSNGTIKNPNLIHRKIMSKFGLYENGEMTYILPAHEGKGIQTGGVINAGAGGAGVYIVGDTGDFKTQTGTGQGASYEVTAVNGTGQITTFNIIDHGSGYAIGDILEFEDGSNGLFSTYTLAGSVLPNGAGGFYKCKCGFARYENFEEADWLDDPNGEWTTAFGDYMVEVNPGADNNGQPQLKVSWTKYSTAIIPPQPNWRTQQVAFGRGFADLNTLLTGYTLGDTLKIQFVRVSGRVDIKLNHDNAGNYVFDAGNEITVASTTISGGVTGHLGKTIKETNFPYVPFLYMSAGVNNNNKVKVGGVMSNIDKNTIITAQKYHREVGSKDQNVSTSLGEDRYLNSLWDGFNNHTEEELSATAPGDPLKLSFMLRMKQIEDEDLVSNGGGFPDNYFTVGNPPNDCNSYMTLGEPQGYLTIPSNNIDNPFTHKLTRPNQDVEEAAYHIEIQELPVISYNGFSSDINKDIMVIPREQLTTGHIAGSLTWNSQYRIPVNIHNVDIMHLNSMTVYIRDSDGKFSTALEKPTQLTLKITEREDFSKSMRAVLKELNSKMGAIQNNQIDNIGVGNRLL